MKTDLSTPANDKAKRKLIFVWNYKEWGGSQIYSLGIMKYAKAAWDVRVVLPEGSSPDLIKFIEHIGVDYEFIDASVSLDQVTSLTGRIRRQKQRILAELRAFRFLAKFDVRSSVLHLEYAPWQSWILYTLLSLKGFKVLVIMHNPMPPSPRWRQLVWRIRLKLVTRLPGFHLLTSNQYTKDNLKGWVTDRHWHRIKVAHTSVDVSEIRQAAEGVLDRKAFRDLNGIPESKCIVLCVAQFIDRKGRWTFLEAAKSVATWSAEVNFVWVAPVAPSQAEQARIESYGLGDRFRLIRSQEVGSDRIDILRFFTVADIFVLPSFVEGLPGSLLEAMVMGLPVVSTNVYAIPEAVRHGENGILIAPGDAQALANEIMALSQDMQLRRRLGEAAKKTVIEHFDQPTSSRIVMKKYQECFERASR